jgi:predicted  nucleic acid-binding Zn-ribbon protein
MPHICTRCNNVFQKGDDILKGCPVCGWKKFLFTRKVPEETLGTDQGSIINKAMGVRIPPRARTIPIEDFKEKTSVSRSPKEEIPHLAHPTQVDKREPEEEIDAKENAKVESIRITAPGTYELNLPSLFERQELIMAVKEGTYLIDLTSAFRKGKKE